MKKITDKRILLPVILVVGLLAAIIWAFSLGGTLPGAGVKATGLVFSEICTKNESVIADNDGSYRDYVELYNGGEDINLEGFFLTDGHAKSEPFGDLPLSAGSYCLLFLDKELTGFSLKATGGDTLTLADPYGRVITQVKTLPMTDDQVMLYGEPDYVISENATPGFSNDKAGLQAFREGSVKEDPVLRISEVLTENVSSLSDEKGQFSDALELYNSGDTPIYLGHYCLSDSPDARFRYRLPGVTLEPGAYQVIYCDGENYISEDGQIHANFGLSRGDILCLTEKDGSYSTLPVQFPGEDVSVALDSEGNYVPFAVSLGYANDEAGATAFAASCMEGSPALVISEVLLSSSDVPYKGSFLDVVEICNRSSQPVDTTGWYLSDGGDPYCYALPAQTLAPGAYMVVQCSRGETGFALSRGEVLRLLAPGGKWASKVSCSVGTQGQSIQRADGEDALYLNADISLGYENTPLGAEQYQQEQIPNDLRISELMSTNASYLKGAYGKTCDWIELYNGSDQNVNLKDYTFSIDSGSLGEYPLPDKTLAPGEYCVILLSEKEVYLSGYSRLSVNLSSAGECVYLSRGGRVIDHAVLPALPTDIAYGRAGGSFTSLSVPTPGSPNADAAPLSAAPQAVTAQGSYSTELDVTLTGKGAVYYTTDCTAPTDASTLYTGPIHLTQTTVIRAVCYEPGKLPSEIMDMTYVINGGHSLPVVSLVAEPSDLWSEETGIYATGPNAGDTYPYFGANFWKDWEKRATVSMFETDGSGFSVKCGLSIFGAYSRGSEKKAFSLNFRDLYGAGSLDYALFGDEGLGSYEAFILRCSGQDAFYSRIRDVLMTSLVADQTTVAVQKYRPVVLYLNGELWGVYFIREKANENYVAGNYNADVKDVSLTSFNGADQLEYTALVNYAHTHDLSVQEHYDYVCSQMDIENYTDFMIAQMYIANTDIDNIKFFKTPDMKWTWLFYDTDLAFSSTGYNTLTDYTNPNGTGGGQYLSTKLINALLKNPEFRDQFIRRFAWQLKNIWSVENVSARVDELEALIKEDMKLDCARWGKSYSGWQGSVAYLKEFPAVRNQKMPQFIQAYFNLTDEQMRNYGFDLQGG